MAEIVVSFLDVGQGDGTWIETNGKKILVDLGTTKNSETTWPEIRDYFRHVKHIPDNVHIDYVFITHGDRDHYNLIPYFNTEFKPTYGKVIIGGRPEDYYENYTLGTCSNCGKKLTAKKILLFKGKVSPKLRCTSKGCSQAFTIKPSDYMGNLVLFNSTPGFDRWLYDMLDSNQADLLPANYYDQTDLGGGSHMQILAANISVSGTNPKSIVLRLLNANNSIILSADATHETESFILNTHPLANIRSNVLKIGHHGSALTSTSSDWVAAVDPEYAFISADRTGDLDKSSGFKLPSQASIDTLLQFGTRIKVDSLTADHKHTCYVPTEFYGKNRSVDSFNSSATGAGLETPLEHQMIAAADVPKVSDHYIEIRSRKAIFTNICTLGDGPEADIGLRFDLVLGEDGSINVHPSSDHVINFDGWPAGQNYRIPGDAAAT